jgi:hypothetical protein
MHLKKLLKPGVVGVVVLVAAGAAYAFWTNGGSGSGSASSGTNAPITVQQTSSVEGLFPGGAEHTLSGNFDNGNESQVFVASIDATIASVTGPNITAQTPCDATDYALSHFPTTIGHQIPSGTGVDGWTGGTIRMINKNSANQDGCKNAIVTIAYTSR